MPVKISHSSKLTSSNVLFCQSNNLKPKEAQFTIEYDRKAASNPHIWEAGPKTTIIQLSNSKFLSIG